MSVCGWMSIGSSITQMTGCLNLGSRRRQLQASFGLSEGQMLNLPTECNKCLQYTYSRVERVNVHFLCVLLQLSSVRASSAQLSVWIISPNIL